MRTYSQPKLSLNVERLTDRVVPATVSYAFGGIGYGAEPGEGRDCFKTGLAGFGRGS